jgi:zinc protease
MDTMQNDELLWQGVRKGDRDAFGQIVERYQSLVCSVAYAGLGEVAGSQDVAQEAFVAAWRQRDDLREPSHLRAWLCGIARTITANIRRRDKRRGGAPDSLDLIQEPATTEEDPLAQAVSREEEALLWRAISALPESYREPLVLFYREDQSIAQVAIQLDLSQETVKQRLSRGRSMLRAEVASMVESALSRSRPGPGFTAGVLAAIAVSIPATSTAAVVSTVAASSAKGAGIGAGTVVGPAAGVATTWIMSKLIRMNGRSPEEQMVVGRGFRNAVVGVWMMVVVLIAALMLGGDALKQSPWTMAIGITVWTAVLLGGIFRISTQLEKEVARIRIETGTTDAEYAPVLAAKGLSIAGPRRYESTWRLLGLPLFAFASGGLDTGGFRSRWARGWIAVGDGAISPLLAIGGFAIAPIAIGGATVGVVSLSLLGVAVGGLALGSLAAGWWAIGFVAVAWEGAVGVVAIPERLAAAPLPWFVGPSITFLGILVPVVVVLSILIPAGLLARRAWRLRRP